MAKKKLEGKAKPKRDALGMEEEKRRLRMDLFLAEFSKRGLLKKSASVAGVTRSLIYQWMEKFPDFAERVEDAKQEVLEAVEEEAYRRALEGVQREEYYKGEVIGQYREYSDRLITLLLKALAPNKYKDTFSVSGTLDHKHSGVIGISMQDVLNEMDKRTNIGGGSGEGQNSGPVRTNGERGTLDLCKALTVNRCGPDGGNSGAN